MHNLEQQIQNLNESIKELKTNNEYQEAYIKVLLITETSILPSEMGHVLSFIKDNKLGIYDNYYSAGEYLEDTLIEYFEENGVDDLDLDVKEGFKQWLKSEGLLTIVGERLLREANEFHNRKRKEDDRIDLRDFINLKSDSINLNVLVPERIPNELKKLMAELKLFGGFNEAFSKLDLEYDTNEVDDTTRREYLAYRALMKVLNDDYQLSLLLTKE